MLKLSSAARLVIRPGPALQFGLDATKVGVIDSVAPEHLGPVIKALESARQGMPKSQLIDALAAVGLATIAAASLIEDLLAFGILLPTPDSTPRVAILGRGPLASLTSELLSHSNLSVRRPLRGESDTAFLQSLSPEMPLIAVDRLAHARALAPAVRNGARRLFVPAQLIDGHGLVGPIANHVSGPCPLCTQLHRVDIDPYWPQLLTQIPGAAPSWAPATVAATASYVVAVVLSQLGLATAALGEPARSFRPGDTLTVDPFGFNKLFHIQQHRHCPLCFEAEQLQQGLAVSRHLDWANTRNF